MHPIIETMSKSKIMHRIPGATQAFNRSIYERRLAEERREEQRQQLQHLQEGGEQGEATSSSAADDSLTTAGAVSASAAAALHAAARILACTSCSVQNDDIDDTRSNTDQEEYRWIKHLGRPLLISAQCGHLFCTDCWDGQLKQSTLQQQAELECPVSRPPVRGLCYSQPWFAGCWYRITSWGVRMMEKKRLAKAMELLQCR